MNYELRIKYKILYHKGTLRIITNYELRITNNKLLFYHKGTLRIITNYELRITNNKLLFYHKGTQSKNKVTLRQIKL